MAARRLLLIPYAGGGPAVFRSWVKAIDPDIEPFALLLPGREAMIAAPPVESLEAAAAAALEALEGIPASPTAIYGHSLGAVLGLELARAIRSGSDRPLAGLHCGARSWPGAGKEAAGKNPDSLNDDDLLAFMELRYGAAHPSLAEPEIRAVALPALRADLTMLASHDYRPSAPLSCPLHVFVGSTDPATAQSDPYDWRVETKGSFTVHRVDGGHFFLDLAAPEICANIAATFRD